MSDGGRRSGRLCCRQDTGEFQAVNPLDFAISLSALLDGFAIQIALGDPTVDARQAFELSMRFAARQLGFEWTGSQGSGGVRRGPRSGHADVGGTAARY
jgi:hypothetical protein